MSIDRYLYVTSTHPRPRWRTPMNAFIICTIIWAGKKIFFFSIFKINLNLVSILFVFPYGSLSSSSEIKKNSLNDCTLSSSHSLFASCYFSFCAFYIFPLIIISLCYTRLWFYMRHVSKSITQYRVSFKIN
jgi:hypothetical protein